MKKFIHYKQDRIMSFPEEWMKLDIIVLSKETQTPKDTY